MSVGALNTPTTFSGTIIANGSAILALTKVGTSSLTLSGVNTYTGNTTISGGTLALSGSGSIASANVSVATGAKFDVSAISGSSYTLPSGTSIGINKVSSTLTQGQLVIGAKNLAYGGALTVTASGDALANGDSFTLVSKNSGNLSGWFSTVSLPVLAAGISWDTNKLATSGVLDIYNFTTTALSLSTPVNTAATVAALKLANHVSSVRLTAAYPASGWTTAVTTAANHGTASFSGSDLTYTPTSGYSGSDSFTVTFYDGHGWQNMAVSVTVGNGNGQSPNLLVFGSQGGNFVLQFAGIPTDAYTVETNSVLDGSKPWVKLGNYTTPSNGIIFVTNNITGGSSLYYRTVYPSY
jgi:autotransporter-associated beta strand protein